MNLCREQNCDRQTNDRQPIVDTPMTPRSNTSLIECHVHLAALPDGDNGGYLSIRQTHDNFFGRIVGATPASGVAFPDFARLATAFGLRTVDVRSHADLPALDAALQQDGPQLLAVTVDPEPGFEPRIKSRALPEA